MAEGLAGPLAASIDKLSSVLTSSPEMLLHCEVGSQLFADCMADQVLVRYYVILLLPGVC
jgi:hypothetical protein